MAHAQRTATPAKGRGGFTLIEVMVATALLGTVMIGMAATATMGAREIRRSKEISVATIKAREVIDEIMGKGFDDTPNGIKTEAADAGRFDFQVVTSVQPRQGWEDLKDVVVSVTDPKGRELQRFTLSIQRDY